MQANLFYHTDEATAHESFKTDPAYVEVFYQKLLGYRPLKNVNFVPILTQTVTMTNGVTVMTLQMAILYLN